MVGTDALELLLRGASYVTMRYPARFAQTGECVPTLRGIASRRHPQIQGKLSLDHRWLRRAEVQLTK